MLLDNKKFLELLYKPESGGCTFTYITTEYEKDPETGRSKPKEVIHPSDGVYCGRLSKETIRPTDTNGLTEVVQTLKLFTHPEIDIPAGSKITVTQQGITTEYQHSGKPAIFTSHQEIPVELWRKKA